MYRKIESKIEEKIKQNDKILLIDGARQIGKTYSIRKTGKKLFDNFIEINFIDDAFNEKLFSDIKNIDDFYFKLSSKYGNKLREYDNTLIFLDEIQMYPQFFTLLKFFREDKKYHFIASGSLLGVELKNTLSIPIGSIELIKMYQFDFEEFLIANGVGDVFLKNIKQKYVNKESLDESTHNMILDYFRKYLIVGGMPEAVKIYVNDKNVEAIRDMQYNIWTFYGDDASKYDVEKKLKIKKVYELIPSQLENKKKRIKIQNIENRKQKFSEYDDEFEYLINSGIAIEVNAISNPHFPLIESEKKSLLKLYMNDVGIFTMLLYRNNINAILKDEKSINLGSVYETVVAQELVSHKHKLFYYDNKKNGEVDYIIDDYDNLSVLPIEVKSGKDYYVHIALNKFIENKDYNVREAIVLNNNRNVINKKGIWYMPIYYVMFI